MENREMGHLGAPRAQHTAQACQPAPRNDPDYPPTLSPDSNVHES